MLAADPPSRRRVGATPLAGTGFPERAWRDDLALAKPPQRPAEMRWAVVAAPLGRMLALANSAGLAGLDFLAETDRTGQAALAAWQRYIPAASWHHAPDDFTATAAALADGRNAAALTLAPWGPPFHWQVWQALVRVPAGAVTTYGQLAAAAGRPGAARAAGRAVATNPVAVLIPCHRVVPADGRVGNYGGGPAIKAALLGREGVLEP